MKARVLPPGGDAPSAVLQCPRTLISALHLLVRLSVMQPVPQRCVKWHSVTVIHDSFGLSFSFADILLTLYASGEILL